MCFIIFNYLDLKTPDGVAWDWVNKRLYWTDAQENTVNRLINGTTKEILVHEELDEPRAIALSPCDGKIVMHFIVSVR